MREARETREFKRSREKAFAQVRTSFAPLTCTAASRSPSFTRPRSWVRVPYRPPHNRRRQRTRARLRRTLTHATLRRSRAGPTGRHAERDRDQPQRAGECAGRTRARAGSIAPARKASSSAHTSATRTRTNSRMGYWSPLACAIGRLRSSWQHARFPTFIGSVTDPSSRACSTSSPEPSSPMIPMRPRSCRAHLVGSPSPTFPRRPADHLQRPRREAPGGSVSSGSSGVKPREYSTRRSAASAEGSYVQSVRPWTRTSPLSMRSTRSRVLEATHTHEHGVAHRDGDLPLHRSRSTSRCDSSPMGSQRVRTELGDRTLSNSSLRAEHRSGTSAC